MEQLETQIELNSSEFTENKKHFQEQLNLFRERLDLVKKGGGPEQIQRHKSRNKLFVRERIEKLVDPGSAFLEFSSLAAWEMYEGAAPCTGLVTGIGVIKNQPCVIVANDATVKGGTYFPMAVKKHLRAQEIAMENGLPTIYLVDSGGAFLPLQSDLFPDKEHFGRIFYNQAQMSAQGIPQISVVMGSCTAGGAYVPAMCDENVIVGNQGTIFLGGPPLVKAATGEEVTAEELGGGRVHCSVSGVTDHFAENDHDALEITRNIVENFNYRTHEKITRVNPEDPAFNPEEIYGILPKDPRKPFDVREIIARVVDGSRFHEFKKDYADTIVTGFAHIWGYPVGIIANNGVLFSESALKAAHFVELCDQRKVPIVFLQNITGFMVGKKYENEGIAKHGAKLVMAVSLARVPKFTVIIGSSYGAGNYGMCGRGYGPRQLWMWPNAKIAVMGGEQAANVLLTVKMEQLAQKKATMSSVEQEQFKKPILDKYSHESSAYFSTARLWDDGIIDPKDTRMVLALGINASLYKSWGKKKKGVFRM